MTSAFATSSGNTAFDFEHEFNQSTAEIDLISSLNPTLVNNVFHSSGDNSEDSIASSHDSPSSYVSGSSEEHGSTIEDFDLYDFGTTYDYNTSSEPFKFSGTQTNSTDVVVDSFLKDFTHPEKTSVHQSAVPMKDTANVTLKNAAFIAAMKQQQQQQQQMIPPQFAQHTMTPQQLQEQYILMQQQQHRAQLVAAQQYAAAYGAQLSPFSNPFMAAAYHQAPMSGFIHPSPTPTTVGIPQPVITPTNEKPCSPKQEQRSPSPPSSTSKQSPKKKTTTTNTGTSSPTTTSTSTTTNNSSTGTKRPRESSKSPTSDALAELESKKSGNVEEDKEIKRQRRLIKNRESAQASRERKKMYVKGLESSVEELSNKNTTLTSKIQALEEENRRLRERLTLLDPSGLHLQDALEPDAKKRKLHKLPLPGKPVSTYNPFDVNFWTSFMGGYPAPQPSAIQQHQQQQPQIPLVQHEQSALAAWANPATLGSKRVVMFIMLFCVAVMVMLPKEITQNTLGGPSQTSIADSPLTKPVSTSPLKKNVGARRLMNAEEDSLTHRIKMIYDEFGKTMQSENGTSTATTTHIKSEVTSDPMSFTVELNKEKKSLVVSFPLDHLEEAAPVTTKTSGASTTTTAKIKEEPVDEDVEMKDSSSSTNTEKPATTAESLSLELLREICHVVNS